MVYDADNERMEVPKGFYDAPEKRDSLTIMGEKFAN